MRLRATVQDNDAAVAAGLPRFRDRGDALEGVELPVVVHDERTERAATQRGVGFADGDELLIIPEQLRLLFRAPRETAPAVGVFAAFHADFVAVVNARR